MAGIDDLQFINRGSELAVLERYLNREQGDMPAAIVIRSSAGVGKSRLTERLSQSSAVAGVMFCIVEPPSQNVDNSIRLHDGFFIQRCAEQLTFMAENLQSPWIPMREFLISRVSKTVKEKKTADLISDLPGPRSAYKIILDYVSRIFSFGKFSPNELLKSDQGDAVRICEEYVESVLTGNRVALIVREAQLCDQRSLRSLMRWTESLTKFDLIVEYTSRNCQFNSVHQKLLYPYLTKPDNYFYVLDLVRLDSKHLEHLIRTSVRSDFAIEAESYMNWDGNLRSILEMQFQITIGHKISTNQNIGEMLCNLPKTIEVHISSLPPLHRMILALCSAHVEPIDERILTEALMSFAPATSPLLLKKALLELVDPHRFLTSRDGDYRINNESVADAILGIHSIKALIAAAEKALRDYYSKLLSETTFHAVGLAATARQLFRLCARTKDVVGLIHATESLTKEIALSQDPSLYAELIASTVSSSSELYGENKEQLLCWAGQLAYEVGNFKQANELLSELAVPDTISLIMLAFSKTETGEHDEALRIAEKIQQHTLHKQTHLAAELIKGLIAGCRGEHEKARNILTTVVEDPQYVNSSLLGYAYRFFECIEDYSTCIEHLYKSIKLLDSSGLQRSKAYSQVAVSVLLARMGDIAAARPIIEEAALVLDLKTPCRHLLLNNMAAIELLSDNPDPIACKRLLEDALRYVRDDYSEVTILSNLSLSHWIAQEFEQARDCVDKVLQILDDHDFASQEIYWPICFNAALVMNSVGSTKRADELLQLPHLLSELPMMNQAYWAFRYGKQQKVDDSNSFLLSRPYHPLYLSLWVIESDGLSLLSPELLQ